MAVPLIEAAHGGDHHAGIGGDLLEIARAPARQGALDHFAGRGLAGRTAQQRQRAVAMVREIGMDAHPAAVAAWVDAGDLVPDIGRHAVDLEVAAALLRRVAHVHRHALALPAAQMPDLGRGQRGGRDAGLGGRADGERRGQHRLGAMQLDVVERLVGQACGAPQVLQGYPGPLGGMCLPSRHGRVEILQVSHCSLRCSRADEAITCPALGCVKMRAPRRCFTN